jgi:hypothetical protein
VELGEALRLLGYVVSIAGGAGGGVAAVWAWGAKKAVANANLAAAAARVEPLEKRVGDSEREMERTRERLRLLEKVAAEVPTREMFANIHTLLERLEGKINTNTVRTESAAKSADAAMEACNRIEGFFIEKGVAR